MAMIYTTEEIKVIKEAWYSLERIFDNRSDAAHTLNDALKYEYRSRGNQWTAQLLIISEVYNRNKIKKENLFSISDGIKNCVIAAYWLFYKPHNPFVQENMNKFNKLAKKAIKVHNIAIERNLHAVCSK